MPRGAKPLKSHRDKGKDDGKVEYLKNMAKVVSARIPEISKEIQGCDGAFEKIGRAIKILTKNTNKIHTDVEKTRKILFVYLHKDITNLVIEYINGVDWNIFVDDFIVDVMEDQEENPNIAPQFRKILTYFKKPLIRDQQITNIFASLNANLAALDDSDDSDDSDIDILTLI